MCQLLQEYADPWIFPFFQVILQFLKPEIKSASFVTTGLMESALAALLSVEHALLKHHSNIDSRHRALLMGHHPTISEYIHAFDLKRAKCCKGCRKNVSQKLTKT